MNYFEAIKIIEERHTDKYGIIVQADGDRGDSASRCGIYYTLRKLVEPREKTLRYKFQNCLDKLQVAKDTYVRHPDNKTPYSNGQLPQEYIADPKRFSRDQQSPLMVGLGFYDTSRSNLNGMFIAQLKRFGKFQNKDISGPQEVSTYIRAYNAWYLYPVLLLTDLAMLVNSGIRVVKRHLNPDDTSDDVVTMLLTIQAYYRLPTPVSWLSRKLYALSKPLDALRSYFREETQAPPLYALYEEVLKQMDYKE